MKTGDSRPRELRLSRDEYADLSAAIRDEQANGWRVGNLWRDRQRNTWCALLVRDELCKEAP